jgi:acyl carrier protein
VSEHPAATALNPEFEAVLRECLDGQFPENVALHEDSDLAAFGIDSLTIVRLLVSIEDIFGVMIPDEMIGFELFSSPGVLWDVISGLMEQPGER